MADFMPWNECQKKFVRKVESDPAKINSMLATAASRLKFLQGRKVDNQNVPFIVEGYYEAIKELLIALLLKSGLRSKNHQCLISYFYINYPQYEAKAHLIAQMSYLRNRLNYYGENIELGFYEKNKKSFEEIITLLQALVKK